jgi:hypothetical protein
MKEPSAILAESDAGIQTLRTLIFALSVLHAMFAPKEL